MCNAVRCSTPSDVSRILLIRLTDAQVCSTLSGYADNFAVVATYVICSCRTRHISEYLRIRTMERAMVVLMKVNPLGGVGSFVYSN